MANIFMAIIVHKYNFLKSHGLKRGEKWEHIVYV